MSPISLFEMAPEGSGELVLLESGLSVLSAIAGTVKVVVLISGTASKSESTVTFEVVERDTIGSGACSLCVIDLTPVASQKDFSSPLLSTLCNLLSISSAMFVHFDVEDNNKNISSLFFFNALLEHFDNNVSVLQQAVLLPPLYYYTLGQGLNAKASKRAVDKMLLTEKGFSEEIGKRNCTRNILSSLSNHKELIQLHDHEGSIITHSSVTDSMVQASPKRLQCLDLSGALLSAYLQARPVGTVTATGALTPRGGVLVEEDLSRLVAPVLQRLQDDAFNFFTQSESTKHKNDALAALPPAVVMQRRSQALSMFQAGIVVTTPQSIASRKLLQARLREAIVAYRAARLTRLRQCCEEKLTDLTQKLFTEEHRDQANSLNLQLKLGETGNVYSQFLTFKNALEKIVHIFLALNTNDLLSEGENKVENEGESDPSTSTSLSYYLEVEDVESSMVKHDVLYAFVRQQVRLMVQMGDAWIGAYEALAAGTAEKMQSLESNSKRVESELEILIQSTVKEKEEAGVRIVALMDTFEAAREEQTRLLEQKQTELDRLVSGLDRTTRLNETDKEDLTNELMKIQEKIQEAQNKSIELRQERENQASTLHNDLLEEERKGHRWFRSTIARQRALLAEELALERQVNQTKSQHMEQTFSLESEHIRNLEKIRTSAQQKRQTYRDDMFRQREKLSQEHDAHMAALRLRNMELDSKLSAANFNISHAESKGEDDKGCVVM